MTTLEQQQKEAHERFDKEFPAHDTSHCTGHPYPMFEDHPNREWVKSFLDTEIAKAYSAGQESVTDISDDYCQCIKHEIEDDGFGSWYCCDCGKDLSPEAHDELKKSLSTEKLTVTKNHEK